VQKRDREAQQRKAEQPATDATAASAGNPSRIVVTENTNETEILYLVSPTEFFALSAVVNNPDVRVDIFQQ